MLAFRLLLFRWLFCFYKSEKKFNASGGPAGHVYHHEGFLRFNGHGLPHTAPAEVGCLKE